MLCNSRSKSEFIFHYFFQEQKKYLESEGIFIRKLEKAASKNGGTCRRSAALTFPTRHITLTNISQSLRLSRTSTVCDTTLFKCAISVACIFP